MGKAKAKHFKSKVESKHLHCGDISNEIEVRLGIYDPKTGGFLKSRNTSFPVEFDETKKDLLIITINKGGL